MQLGMSKHWSEQMSMITEGKTNQMSGESLLKYFSPLYFFLEEQNRNNDDCVGWEGKNLLRQLLCTLHFSYNYYSYY